MQQGILVESQHDNVDVVTAAGLRLRLRRATLTDLEAANHLHRWECSAESRRARYHASRDRIRHAEWRHLIDPDRGYTFLIACPQRPGLIGLAHLLWQDCGPPEIALLIADAWQGRGVGTAVARHVAGLAAAHGHPVQQARIMSGNFRAIRLASRFRAIIDDAA
ncbi:RimJ/RimL family protein N-acetyltransferase [Micromonospora vinacea]|uniref:RimJ/RimL family protein N-acetyltransferase n=1 Tax=Micromonospora vinacea TaxID=709878 RepID=A0ABS0KBI3_9ACTN|nr:GNAT family N-acetyltransferase [Micromonospora vinacea]MBG6105995.1 RimJ/RimL family protein N-acetyltransferase [Micromonospora vinacea]WTA65708.1 GNAT family N-acetyltransferase [Micromonospora sp. NBC_00855]